MNRIKTVFAALICAFAITSCSNDKLNGEWKLVELLNTPVGEYFNEPFLKIEDGRYNGNTGVNFINGEIETCPFKKCVEFEDGPCTRMAADPQSMAFERSFLEALDEVEEYVLDGDTLYLNDDHGNVLMKLVRKQQ